MADFSIVDAKFAVGAAVSDASDVEQLKLAANVGAIIDCRLEFDDKPLMIAAGIDYLWIGVDDDGKPKPVLWFQQGLAFAKSYFGQGEGKRLYVHCAAGINRGPSMCYFLLRAIEGLSAAEAEGAIRKVRPQVGLAYKADADAAITALTTTT